MIFMLQKTALLKVASLSILANWLVGEAAGLIPKTKDSIYPQSLEFQRAQLSKAAIQRILETHQKVIRNADHYDLVQVDKAVGVEQHGI